MSKFYVWIDHPTTQTYSASEFKTFTERIQGFTKGDVIASRSANTAIRQANLVVVALMNALNVSDNIDLMSSVEDVTNEIYDRLVLTSKRNNFEETNNFIKGLTSDADIVANDAIFKTIDVDKDLATQYSTNSIVTENGNKTYTRALPLKNGTLAIDSDITVKPIQETETVIVDTTTLAFTLDSEHDTGMYVSTENAISLGNQQLNWSDGRQKYKVIWDGVEYICYGQTTTQLKFDDAGEKISTYHDWQILGNGNNKLNCYNKDTNIYPFAITQDKWKNNAEWLVYTTSTASTHTIKVVKVEGTYEKATPEYQYGYLSMLKNGRNNATLLHGFSFDDAGLLSGILSGDGNEYDSSAVSSAQDVQLYIFGNGNRITRKGSASTMRDVFVLGSNNIVKANGRVANTLISGYSNAIDNDSQNFILGILMSGQQNTLSLDSGLTQSVYGDMICGVQNTVSYNKSTGSLGLNTICGGFNTIGNSIASIVGGFQNTILDTGDVAYSLVNGYKNTVGHSGVIITGRNNATDRNFQFVSGKYSVTNENALVKIGNGTSDTDRSNAFEVLLDGRAKVYGAPTENNDVLRLGDWEVITATEIQNLFS